MTWPSHALAVFDSFLDQIESQNIDRKTKLTVLAKLGSFDKNHRPALRRAIGCQILKENKALKKAPSLHLGRIFFYTWLPIRVRAAWDPRWLDHPLLSSLRQDPSFAPEALDRLCRRFKEHQDILGCIRRLSGHSSEGIPLEHYIRSLPIMVAVIHDLEFGPPLCQSPIATKQMEFDLA